MNKTKGVKINPVVPIDGSVEVAGTKPIDSNTESVETREVYPPEDAIRQFALTLRRKFEDVRLETTTEHEGVIIPVYTVRGPAGEEKFLVSDFAMAPNAKQFTANERNYFYSFIG